MKVPATIQARVSGGFFEQYKEVHGRLTRHLETNEIAALQLAAAGTNASQFTKTLLAQTAFLYFLQAKNWIQIPASGNIEYFYQAVQPLFARLGFLKQNLPCTIVPGRLLRNGSNGVLDVFDKYCFTHKEEACAATSKIIDPGTITALLENTMSTTERRHNGIFYTPAEIVQYMCRASLAFYLQSPEIPLEDIKTWMALGSSHPQTGSLPETIVENADLLDDSLSNITICDPAAGSGAFALGMLHELVNTQQKLLPYLSEEYLDKKLRRIRLAANDFNNDPSKYFYSIKLQAIRESIYGIDIDPFAVDIARMRLWLYLIADEKELIPLKELPMLDYKIKTGNALTDFPGDWQNKFNIVIGNPPYGIYQGKKKDELEIIKRTPHFSLAKGQKLNAFELFLCIAPRLSKPASGIISLIFQNSFLADTSSKLLRQFYLQQQEILGIDSFPGRDDVSKRVFRSAKMSVCILFARNNKPINNAFNLNIWQDCEFKMGTTARIAAHAIAKLDPVYYSIPSVSEAEYEVLQHLSTFKKLSDIAHCYEGEINLTVHKQYLSTQPLQGYYKMIKGASIHRWRLVKKMSQGVEEYVSPDYLIDCIASAKSRHYRMPRLVLQGITGVDERFRLKCALLNGGTFCGNSANYVLFQDPRLTHAYLAILNSELQNWFFKKYSTNSNVNGYEVDNLPIVNFSKPEAAILENMGQYLSCIAGNENFHTPYTFFDALNNAVNYQLFFRDDLIKAGVEIVRHIVDLPSLAGVMHNEEKEGIIQSAFNRLNDARCPLLSNMKALYNVEPVRIIAGSLQPIRNEA